MPSDRSESPGVVPAYPAPGDGIAKDRRSPAPVLLLVVAGGFTMAGWGRLAWLGDLRQDVPAFLGVWIVLAGVYAAAVAIGFRIPARTGLVTFVVVTGLSFRAVMLLPPASLSDDIHRYVRDGWVQVNGVNPFAYAPDDPALERLRLPDHDRINNPSISTIYPPLAQMLFLAAAAVRPNPLTFRLMFFLFDAGLIFLLLGWLRASDRNPLRVIVYAWHPLAILEGVGSGHVDVVGVFFLALSVRMIIGERRFASSVALAASVLAKLLPLMLLPVYLRRWRLRDAGLFAAVLLIATAPYAAGARGRLFSGLSEYSTRWEFNGSIFPVLRSGVERLDATDLLKEGVTRLKDRYGDSEAIGRLYRWVYPPYLARAGAGLLALLIVCGLNWRAGGIERQVLAALGVVILLSPTVHPWYLLWLLPFLTLETSAAWLWLTLVVPFAYLALSQPDGAVPLWVRLLEYGPMLPILAAQRFLTTRRSAC